MTDYGVVTDSTVDNTPAIRRAVYAAARVALLAGRPARHEWTRIEAPCGTIGYQGQLRIPAIWLEIVGCGGARVTDQVDDGGIRFRPVRENRETGGKETRFRLLDNAVARVPVNNWTVENLGTRRTTGRGAYSPDRSAVRFSDLVLDGNWAGNLAAYRAIPADRIKSRMQDSPSWTGITAGDHNGYQMCMADGTPARIEITRVSVRGYGATGVLGGGNRGPFHAFAGPDRVSLAASCSQFRLDQVLAGDVLHNHALYGVTGSPGLAPAYADSARDAAYGLEPAGWRDVTVTGFAWTHVVSTNDTQIHNLVFERWQDSPGRDYDGHILNPRAGYFEVDGMYVDTRAASSERDPSATGSEGAEDGIRFLVNQNDPTSITVQHAVWRAGLVDYVFQGGGQGSHWSDVRVYAERGIKTLVSAAPARVSTTRVGIIDLDRWQVVTPPEVGGPLVSTRRLNTVVNITDSRLEGFDAPLSANAVGKGPEVNITDTDARPFARGTPHLIVREPSPAAPLPETGGVQYRIEAGTRRCRNLRTGRLVSYVPHCSSL